MNDANKRLKIFAPLFFSIVLILGMFLGFKLRDKAGYERPFFSRSADIMLHQVLRLIDMKYVDSVNVARLRSDAINGLLQHLDPHSVYIPPRDLRGINEEMQGSFHGIGIAYYIIRDTINVTQVLSGGPAEKAGLKIGDQLLRASDSVVAGVHIDATRIRRLLQGPLHSVVPVEIKRKDTRMNLDITRGIIPIKSLDAAYMIAPHVAYVRINRFSARTYSEFMDAIVALKKDHSIDQFILDLRGNPGGYLDAAVHIADEFLSGDKEVVSTRGKSYPDKTFRCGKAGEFETIPLAVLVNERSASASEILAGALQDWDRAYIIGRQTYGKGLVQEQYNLINGAALRLTVARYYLPSGRLIQRPYKHRMGAYQHDLVERFAHGEMLHKDSIHFEDTTAYFTLEEHRRVHAGGGVMPDVFVPLDTTRMSSQLMALYRQHLLFRFAYAYHNQHTEKFATLKSPEDLLKAHILPENLPAALHAFAPEATGLQTLPPQELANVRLQIKAFIARELWQDEGYYYLINQQDRSIEKARQILLQQPDLRSFSPDSTIAVNPPSY